MNAAAPIKAAGPSGVAGSANAAAEEETGEEPTGEVTEEA
jgi:hypothetical protein